MAIIDVRQPTRVDRNRDLSMMMVNQILKNRILSAEENRQIAREERAFERKNQLQDRALMTQLSSKGYTEAKEGTEGAFPFQFSDGVKYFSAPPEEIESVDPFKDVSDNELYAMAQDPNNPNSAKAQAILEAKRKARDQGLEQSEYEILADAVESGRNTLANIATGSRGSITKTKVAKILESRGVDVTSIETNRKSKESALRSLEKTQQQLKAFEETAKKNLMYAQDVSNKYVRSRYPAFNKVKALWDTQTGDPLIEQFKTATYTGILEAMKHNTAGSGITAAELSVRAQEKADEILNTAKSWQQFDSIVNALFVDMENRASSYADQVIKLKEMPLNEYMASEKSGKKKTTNRRPLSEY